MVRLPNFFIIGAAKAGTTSICHYLSQHPQIYISPEKEPRFFTPEFYERDTGGPIRNKSNNQAVTEAEYASLFNAVTDELAIGEASTEYIVYEQAPQRIRESVPDAKIIAILRDPVERAFSAYCYQLRDGCEDLSFEKAIDQEQERIENCWRPGWLYAKSGFYGAQLSRYFENFPKENIRIYRYEELKHEPQDLCEDIFRFLGVDETFQVNDLGKKNVSVVPKSKHLNKLIRQTQGLKSLLRSVLPKQLFDSFSAFLKGRLFDKKPELTVELRNSLASIYEMDLELLERLVGKEFKDWRCRD
ncbi:MAG: sulfotransferase [Cyanobacteria bacterium J06649_11]